jgi:hypothetical protein
MAATNRVGWEILRVLNSTTLGDGLYHTVGTPLINPSYKLKLVNNSTVILRISIDGINDVDVAPPGSFWLYDESIIGNLGNLPAVPAGTQILVKSETGLAGTGNIYLVSQYIIQG